MRDFAKENAIDQRLLRLERELAALCGRNDMMQIAVTALIATHPNPERVREAIKPMLQGLQFPGPEQRAGFDQALTQFRQALGPRPDGQTS